MLESFCISTLKKNSFQALSANNKKQKNFTLQKSSNAFLSHNFNFMASSYKINMQILIELNLTYLLFLPCFFSTFSFFCSLEISSSFFFMESPGKKKKKEKKDKNKILRIIAFLRFIISSFCNIFFYNSYIVKK